MKKALLLLMVTVLTFSLAHALLPSFGIKGGVNMAQFYGSDVQKADYKTGASAGIFVCLDLIALKLQPEVLYSQKGSKSDLLVKADYLEVPVLAKFSFGKIIVPSIYAGPSFGRLLSASVGGIDVKDSYNSTDLGLIFGAEVKLPIKISLEARYDLGLTQVPKESNGVQLDAKNSAISVMLGYYMF